MKIVVFGPGPRFKGGMANYTVSLAKACAAVEGTNVSIVSWTQQYPSIIPRDFIDRSSKQDLLEGTPVSVTYVTNYNNPASWYKTARVIANMDPDIVVFQWALAVQGLPMGTIAKRLQKICDARIIFDLHVVRQKEGSFVDKMLIRRGLSYADTYIVHALKTYQELCATFPAMSAYIYKKEEGIQDGIPVLKLYHPVYDMFKPDPAFDKEAVKTSLGLRKNVFLFFGFIRKYKGLHHVIRSFANLAKEREDVSLLIVGESFWQTLDTTKFSTKVKKAVFGIINKLFLRRKGDGGEYNPLPLIDELGIRDRCVVVNRYVPNEEVHTYFQVSDCNVLFYETATPSGVESVAYNFLLPSIATNVGHFSETIKDGYNGYLAEPENVGSMTAVMRKFLEQPIPRERIAETAKLMSWENYAKTICEQLSVKAAAKE